MRKFLHRLAVLAVLLLAISTIVTITLSRVGSEEKPPCRACAKLSSEPPQVSVCELSSNAVKFGVEPLRVMAELRNDSGQLFLKDAGCTIPAGFQKEKSSCDGALRKLQITCGLERWYDGAALVRVVGSMSKIPAGNYYAGEDGFTISCLEGVQTEPRVGARVNFAFGRLFSIIWGNSN